MKVVIFTLGSRGDVQPYLGRAVGLQRAGHQVALATSKEFTPLIQSYGVTPPPVRFSVQALMQEPETRAILRGRNPVAQFRLMQGVMHKSAEAMDDYWEAAQSADFLVQTGTGNGGIEEADRFGHWLWGSGCQHGAERVPELVFVCDTSPESGAGWGGLDLEPD